MLYKQPNLCRVSIICCIAQIPMKFFELLKLPVTILIFINGGEAEVINNHLPTQTPFFITLDSTSGLKISQQIPRLLIYSIFFDESWCFFNATICFDSQNKLGCVCNKGCLPILLGFRVLDHKKLSQLLGGLGRVKHDL